MNENYELELDTLACYWRHQRSGVSYHVYRINPGCLIAISVAASRMLPEWVEYIGLMQVQIGGSGSFHWADKKLKRYLYEI